MKPGLPVSIRSGTGSSRLPSLPTLQVLPVPSRSTISATSPPRLYGVDNSFWPITYVILGGLGTLAGPVVGTVVLTIIWEGLKATGMTFGRYVIIGVILILAIIFLPRGLVSLPEEAAGMAEDGGERKRQPEPAAE